MTKQELTESIKELTKEQADFNWEDFIDEANAYAHRKCQDVSPNTLAYDNSKYWGKVTAFMVSVARKNGYLRNKKEVA